MPGILIVDDNPSIRLLLRRFIEADGHIAAICGEASNGVEAIKRANELHPDIVLMDFSMPMMNGLQAAAILKRTLPVTKIILFTLHADELTHAHAAQIGIDVVMSKADGIAKLPHHLKNLLSPADQRTQSTTLGANAQPS